MAKVLLAIAVLLLCTTVRCAVFTVQAGATSNDGNWILRGYYPLNVLADTFSIEEGDSIKFVVGGFAKAITITDRLFIPIIDDATGTFDPAFTTPSSTFPITVSDPSNETYTSGFLPVNNSVEFIFAQPGKFEIFEIMEGKIVASIVVNPAGTSATYSPVQIARYLIDAVAQDELEGFKNLATATDASSVAAGALGMSYSVGTISYVGFVGGNPVSVVVGTSLKFINRDVRPLNVFVNTSNEFNVPAGVPFGGATFLTASGDGIGEKIDAAVSSGIIYAGGTFSILFSKLGTYTWHSTIGGFAGNITVVNPPPKLKPLSGGRAFAAFVVVVAVLLLIFIIGCVVIIICKQACIQAKTLEAAVEKSISDMHLTDNL